jgi:hypothetical protein
MNLIRKIYRVNKNLEKYNEADPHEVQTRTNGVTSGGLSRGTAR